MKYVLGLDSDVNMKLKIIHSIEKLSIQLFTVLIYFLKKIQDALSHTHVRVKTHMSC